MSIELLAVILLIPSYICLIYVLKKVLTYANGYSKGFNDAKRIYESRIKAESEVEDGNVD